ncbi:MAG: leucine-rich repeat domain-containing protein [Ruminococcaceae bacterium]|nr:leucine-rich repeat domain-containing protein [Oscillospiraceae bacterium]
MIPILSEEEKSAALLTAVINQSPEEISATYKELGYLEMSAAALGTACRFCGVDAVRALVEGGAKFSFPESEEIEKAYSCYVGTLSENYRTNYSLYLLKIFKHIKGACCFKGTKLLKKAVREDKKALPFLSDEERVKVLDYLYETRDKIDFDPSEMLFYAYFAQDDIIVDELKKLGVTLSETRIKYITNGGASSDGYWYEWCSLMGNLNKENLIPIMNRIRGEFSGKFHFTEWLYHRCEAIFFEPEIFEYFIDNFKQEKMNKSQIIRELIDKESVDVLPIIEKAGWLSRPQKRDEMIKYASDNNKTECTAWLMDFKNRTADFAAEREKAEKKMRRELNAAPNSVTALKQIWSYKKQENGELIITNYKGSSMEVVVPETIGKSTVTIIGNGAFATESGRAGVVYTNATYEQLAHRRQITKITLPKTIKKIDIGAFIRTDSLQEIEIPDGVEEIGMFAFYECNSLTRIVIPGSVKTIGKFAFAWCKNLKEVIIHNGVEEINECAFYHDIQLERIEIPASVKIIKISRLANNEIAGAFHECPKLSVICPKDSEAEKYCEDFGYKIND